MKALTRKILALVFALVMALSLVSCGGEEAPSTQSPDATTAASPGQSSGTIKIAMSTGLTGPLAEVGVAQVNTAEMLIEEINNAGGINGQELELVVYDDKADVTESTLVAQRIVQDPDFVCVIGPLTSSTALATLPIYEAAGLPMLNPTANSVDIKGTDFIRMCLASDVQGPQLTACAVNNYGKKKLAVIYPMSDFGTGMLGMCTNTAEKLGAEIVMAEPYTAGTDRDFSVHLSKLEKSGADGVLLLGDYNETSMIISQADRIESLSDMQYFMDASILSEVFLERIKDISHEENCIIAAGYNPYDDRDLYKEFAQKLKDKFGIDTNEAAVYTYDLINILAQALEAGATRETLADTIKSMEFENMMSASGTIKFNADGNREALDIAIIGVKDNAFYYTGNSVDMTGAME